MHRKFIPIPTSNTSSRTIPIWKENETGKGNEGEIGEITSITTANHKDGGGSADELANKRAKSSITLVPIKRTSLLQITSVPVDSIAVVVGVAARHIPVHVYTYGPLRRQISPLKEDDRSLNTPAAVDSAVVRWGCGELVYRERKREKWERGTGKSVERWSGWDLERVKSGAWKKRASGERGPDVIFTMNIPESSWFIKYRFIYYSFKI